MRQDDINRYLDEVKYTLTRDSAWLTPLVIDILVNRLENLRSDISKAYKKEQL